MQGIILYGLIYWLAIFAVLPFGVKTAETVEQGNSTGAPVHAHMKKKFIVTAFVAAALWLMIFTMIKMDFIDFPSIGREMANEDHIK